MAWFKRLGFCAVPELRGLEPVLQGFEGGHGYEQIDLDGRDAVEGVAEHYIRGNIVGGFAARAVVDIEITNAADPGHYVVFTGNDDHGDLIAMVYERTSWIIF